VVVLGARGSGKTSLLNCAASSVLSGLPVTASQFCRRVWRVDQLQGFLRRLFQFSEETDLQAALSEGRRVVILEELERTFLRTVGGFEAIGAFLRLVEATSKSTLWILSINEISFQYLNAAVSLGGTFSHRINAMSVRREYITNAILQRHNLSGLRLEFAPLPEGDARIGRLRKLVGLEQDAQELFSTASTTSRKGSSGLPSSFGRTASSGSRAAWFTCASPLTRTTGRCCASWSRMTCSRCRRSSSMVG
jgi:hypothetical protein